MHIFKSFLVSLITVFFVAGSVFAANESSVKGGVRVADVAIRDGAIVSQEGNTLSIAFTIINGEGTQAGVKYGVQVISQTGKTITLVDEKIFDEKLSLAENSSIQRTVSYTAPATLSGEYQLILSSKNEMNFPFAFFPLGKVSFSGSQKGIVIDGSSCKATLNGQQATYTSKDVIVLSNKEQVLTVSCIATNSGDAVSVKPVIITKEFGSYGALVETDPVKDEMISFAAGEKKSVSVVVPSVVEPGTYMISLSLASDTSVSNSTSFSYVLQGPTASIVNLSLDKDSYEKGDTAKLSIVWNTLMPSVNLTATLKNGLGLRCAKPLEQTLSTGTTEVSFPVTSSCSNPHVEVTFQDGGGAILDEAQFSVDPNSGDKKSRAPLVVLIAVLILAAIGFLVKKKIKNNPTTGVMVVLLPLILMVGIALPLKNAEAATYLSGGGDIITVVDLLPTTYNGGSNITLSWYVQNQSLYDALPVSLTAINDIGLGASNPSHTFLPTTTFNPGAVSGGGVPTVDSITFAAPVAGGTYSIDFETAVLEPVYLKVTPQGVSQWQDVIDQGAICPDVILEHYVVDSFLVEFFSDPLGTVPLDVSGMGFRLGLIEGRPYPLEPAGPTFTSILSGTSYTISPGLSRHDILGNFLPPFTFGCGGIAIANLSGFALWTRYTTYPVSPWPPEITVPYRYYITPPTPYISAVPNATYPGNSVDVMWGAGGATSCTGTGFSTGGAPYGSQSVAISTLPTTLSINCSNVAGSASASTDIDLAFPSVQFSAEPQSVLDGNSTTVTWSSTGANSCTSTDFSTGGATSGTAVVTPSNGTQTYNLSCTNAAGTTPATVDVYVEYPVACYDEYGGLYYCNPGQQCTGAPQWGCQ